MTTALIHFLANSSRSITLEYYCLFVERNLNTNVSKARRVTGAAALKASHLLLSNLLEYLSPALSAGSSCSSREAEPFQDSSMMTVKASVTPADGVINNKTKRGGGGLGKSGGGIIWAELFPVGGRRGHGESRSESHCPGMCYLTSALCGESVSGQQKRFFLGGGNCDPPV